MLSPVSTPLDATLAYASNSPYAPAPFSSLMDAAIPPPLPGAAGLLTAGNSAPSGPARDSTYQACTQALSKAEAAMNAVRQEVSRMQWNGERLAEQPAEAKESLQASVSQALVSIAAARRACNGIIPKSDEDKLSRMQKELNDIMNRLRDDGAGIDLRAFSDVIGRGLELLGGVLAFVLRLLGGDPGRQPV